VAELALRPDVQVEDAGAGLDLLPGHLLDAGRVARLDGLLHTRGDDVDILTDDQH
jgi:hypothetical protein